MEKKNKKRPRKRKPLKTNSKRQAHASLNGYLYQIWHSVNAWLDLADDEVLYLEGAEDFDILSDDTATATQVKHTQRNITLKFDAVADAINNFWKLRTNNPDRRVKFRFLTCSKIGMEQGNPFGKDKRGLELWQRCAGSAEAITKISDFLQTEGKISDEVKNFLKQSDPQEIYEQLIEPVGWETESKSAGYVEQSIREYLIHHGDRYSISPPDAEKVVAALITEAWRAASDEKNPELTRKQFLEIFAEHTRVSVPIQDTRGQQTINLKTFFDSIKEALFGDSPDLNIAIQSKLHTQNTVPPLLPDVIPREELLTNIQTKLQSEGIAVIQGGTGKGKTTLANLTTRNIDGNWSWLSFTNKEPSQIAQLLQQLSIAVSNQSAQVNVVLDDLNLQPQQLRTYEEALGIVIYRLMERGAKLLITSQHKPPNNFIRYLGASKTITVDVPNFTIPEIEHFAAEMGCPTDDAETWRALIQAHTGGHPRLVHAWLFQLREKGWDEQNILTNLLQPPEEVVEEREAARLLLTDLPEEHRKFLYRLSLMSIGFRKDYALNIAEIPDSIPYSGDVFSQLVGPWIDRVNETYYTISPLLTNSAKEVWPDNKIKGLHAHIANAILKTKKLAPMEAWAVFTHSMAGQYTEGIIAFIYSLMNAPQNDWDNICQEFSLLVHIKIDPPEELFPGDAFLNQMFRSLQYSIAVEVEPKRAPNILEIWDKETQLYESCESYPLSRLMLATEVLRYNQVSLPARKLVNYLKEMIAIKDSNKKTWEIYLNSMGHIEEYITDKSNFFSFLFTSVSVRPNVNAAFLNELIDALDELDSRTRTLLLAEFEDYNIDCLILTESIFLKEKKQKNPDWTKCLQVYDKVIERSLAWGYNHVAALSARGKAIVYDEYLNDPDAAHQVLQNIISTVGDLPVIMEAQAVVYLRHEHYQEALDIYERILPEWYQASEQLGIGPLEGYRRAAICAAYLDDWKKAAAFFEERAKRTQEVENTERYIGLYADAGFAHFKAGNMFNCIKLLHQALQNFETLPQDNTDITYFTLKKRLGHTIKWIKTIWYESGDNSPEPFEPAVGFCSDPETKEEFLTLPDCPIGYAWLFLAQIEYRFGHETTVFQHALQTTDREEYPFLNCWLSFLEAKYEFRNKTFDNLPQCIYQLAPIYSAMKKHKQSGRGAGEKGSYSISDSDLSDFASGENIIAIFVAALLVEIQTNRNAQDTLAKWRTNSSELPIKEHIYSALDLIESILLGNYNNAFTVMYTPNEKVEKQLAASIRVIYNQETSLEDLLFAHTIISSSFINSPWEDFVVKDLEILLSTQWLQKIEFRAKLKTPMLTVPQIEKACKSNEIGKKKIGQILLAVHQAVSVKVPLSPKFFQQVRAWVESEQKQALTKRKNPAAQRLIKAMEKPPHLTDEDIEALNQSIKEGKIPIKFDSPFESDERENNE